MTGMPLRLISLGFATLLVLSSAIGQVPTPTPDKKAGGRHGKFHFTTDEQIAVDANRRKQIREKLASLRQDLDTLAKDPAAKQRLSSEIGAFEAYVNAVEHSETHSASPVAAQEETILNEKKGMSHCTMCHEAGDPSHSVSRTSRR